MVMRNFIEINEDKCNGCGNCVVDCEEGALKIIDGKAKVIKESFCDGLGACIGSCPTDALKIVQRDVDAYDHDAVEEHVKTFDKKVAAGRKKAESSGGCGGGCPGNMIVDNTEKSEPETASAHDVPSELRQWPVMLHLVNPEAPYFKKAKLLIASTCSAFSYGNFHRDYIKDHVIVVACPKLDRTEGYVEKLAAIIASGGVDSVTVARMQVPCCMGLTVMAKNAIEASGRKVPFLEEVISIDGKQL